MEFLKSDFEFSMLSLRDLLAAREFFHVHLMHKANVVGTAVGRYLVRKTDPYPPQRAPEGAHSEPRTLQNSEVREYSWPCVIVLVSKWAQDDEFGVGKGLAPADFVPKTIYLPDGRKVPICVVEASLIDTAIAPSPLAPIDNLPGRKLSGGLPIVTTVQGVDHVASAGCLVTDGHLSYLLTSRHVAGNPGDTIAAHIGGTPVKLGKVSDRQLGIVAFKQLYESWPGDNTFVNVDVALIEVPDVKEWSAAIDQLGILGPLADLSTHNLSLHVIGCPVRATGGVSGPLEGKVAALFYRYKAVGGREYMADFLIGSRTDAPLETRPGDSGTVWVVDGDGGTEANMPLAVQWGGAVFGNAYERQPFALASNLSNVCRELSIEIIRASYFASFEYWGAVGHYTIGSLACTQAQDPRLRQLLMANQDRISFRPEDIDRSVNDVSVPGFVELADVPDKVWKFPQSQETPFGRKGIDNPNHYADIDLAWKGQASLDAQTPNVAALKTATWKAYYQAIGFTTASSQGILPFRVWQIYKEMEHFVKVKDVDSFIAAAGILAHYVGDACQPLHGSMFDDGDPFKKADGTPTQVFQHHGHAFGNGVHSAYEASMLNIHYKDLVQQTQQALGASHGMTLVSNGPHAGFATIELIRRSHAHLPPKTIVDKYIALKQAHSTTISDPLWAAFGAQTVQCVADGCRTLAMLWDSAWKNGDGAAILDAEIKPRSKSKLQVTYEKQSFLRSKTLTDIDSVL